MPPISCLKGQPIKPPTHPALLRRANQARMRTGFPTAVHSNQRGLKLHRTWNSSPKTSQLVLGHSTAAGKSGLPKRLPTSGSPATESQRVKKGAHDAGRTAGHATQGSGAIHVRGHKRKLQVFQALNCRRVAPKEQVRETSCCSTTRRGDTVV